MEDQTPTQLKGWDQYVADARVPPVVLPISDTEVLTVAMPTRKHLRELNLVLRTNNEDALARALFGDLQGERLIELAEDAPGLALNAVCWDVLNKFGLQQVVQTVRPRDLGDSSASST
jgi:hypothetical protein